MLPAGIRYCSGLGSAPLAQPSNPLPARTRRPFSPSPPPPTDHPQLMAAADPEFAAELRREGIPETLITWLLPRCPNGARFAFYVDRQQEIQEVIVDQVEETKGSRSVRAALVEVWRRHQAAQERRLTRSAAGIGEQDWEDPLESHVKDNLYDNFQTYYHFRLRPTAMLADNLLARIKREVDRQQYSVIPVSRVRSQAVHVKSPLIKKIQVSAMVAMDIGAAAEAHTQISGIPDYLDGLQILMNGYAVVGCFEVRGADGSLRASRWLPWDTACEYVDRIRRKLSASRASITDLRKADESTRELWMDLQRNERLTMGEAIVRAFVESAPYWLFSGVVDTNPAADAARRPQHFSPGGAEASGSGRPPQQFQQRGPTERRRERRSRTPAQQAFAKQAPGATNSSANRTARSTTRGKTICNDWNSGRCQQRCPRGFLHVCNFMLANNVPCASPAHRRTEAHG